MSFLAKTRNPGVTKCVIPGEDQESRSHPGPSVSFLAKTRNPGVTIMKTYYVYILASKRNGTLYIGVTNDLIKRVYEHKNNLIEGFTNKYKVHRLVYYETTSEITSALHRENNLRNGNELGKSNSLRKTILNGKIYMKPFSHPGFLVFARNDNSMRRKPVDFWSSPGMTTRYKCVIPGEDQESRSNQVCHSWRRPGIQE